MSAGEGEISYSKVRAVTRVATPENEAELVNIALGGTAGQVERIVRAWRKVDAALERALATRQEVQACLTTYIDEDGMTVAERRAEALGVVARSALKQELDPGNGGDRYQVVVHVDQKVLDDPESAGASELETGVGVSAETSRRLACDATVVTMHHDEKGAVLDVGRKTRTIPTPLRRALDARDPTCVWPGCECKFVDGHHLEFWSKGGETKLSNLCNVCSYHHHPPVDLDYLIENAWTPPKGTKHPVWSG